MQLDRGVAGVQTVEDYIRITGREMEWPERMKGFGQLRTFI